MARLKMRVDPLTVSAYLREHGADKFVPGEYIGELLNEVIVPLPMIEYARGWVLALRSLVSALEDSLGAKQRHQVIAARDLLTRDGSAVMTYPIMTLAGLRGGWMPGEVDVLAAASNSGKTTLLSTFARRWVADGKRVYYAGFELPAANLRLQWAAHEAGFMPGDIVSGEYLTRPDAERVKERVRDALAVQEERVDFLRCADASFVDVKSLQEMGREAAAWGADVFIIDHIDHVSGSGDLHAQSRQVVSTVLELAKSTGVRYLVATQLNQQGLAQDTLRSHRPVREEFIKQGGHKKEVATFMMGLARAINPDANPDDVKAVRDRRASVTTIEEPYTSQVNVMKHRHYGDRVGKSRKLTWERGEYTDYLSDEERKASSRVLRRNDLHLQSVD
jgi:KaiC/GvpD/RAD55 family RecA-like ATPase